MEVCQHPLQLLIDQLKKMPGVGAKSAQRLAFFFLTLSESEVQGFCDTLLHTKKNIQYCEHCFNLSWESTCWICSNPARVSETLCVVAESKDILALEKTLEYKGLYHVLGGLISPMDGIHLEALRLQELLQRVKTGTFKEIILALNPTVEGDATIHYLKQCLEPYHIRVSQLAYGLPFGGDIDYTDEMTLQKALLGRTPLVMD